MPYGVLELGQSKKKENLKKQKQTLLHSTEFQLASELSSCFHMFTSTDKTFIVFEGGKYILWNL